MPGRFAAYLGSSIFLLFGMLIRFSALRSFWLKVLPSPGTMPNRETMEKASWHGVAVGHSDETGGNKPVTVRAECKVTLFSYLGEQSLDWRLGEACPL